MFQRITKNGFGLVVSFFGVLLALWITLLIVTSNYMSISEAFYLLHYDQRPLASDSLVGSLFGTFCPNATLAQFYGASMAVGIALGFFLVWRTFFGGYDSWQAMCLHQADGNTEQVRAFRWDLFEKLVTLLLFAVTLGCVVAWDMQLFRYRSSAQATMLGSPNRAITMAPWMHLLSHPSFALNVAGMGAWSYVALTSMVCLSLEVAGRHVGKYMNRLYAEIAFMDGAAKQDSFQKSELRGYDADGNPVYDVRTRLAYDAEGNAIDVPQSVNEVRADENREKDSHQEAWKEPGEGHADSAPLFVVPKLGDERGEEKSGVSNLQSAELAADTSAPSGNSHDEANIEKLPVIGTDERVSWSTAAKDPDRYYCDFVNGVIWSRGAYESLHGVTLNSSPSAE